MTTQTNYLINWIGGKRLLRKTIAELIPTDIKSYIEVFGGGAWVLFYKARWANLEVYNDLDNNLYNLFNIVKFHAEAFIKEFQFMINSRKGFKDMLEFKPLTDIQKAAKFFFLLQRSYGAKMKQFAYNRNGNSGSAKSHSNIIERIQAISSRLDMVFIENLDFEDLIRRYDHKDAFFYLDPPYIKGKDNIYKIVKVKDFEHDRLFNCIKNIKGRWLLSYDDNEYIRQLYKDFKIIEVSRANLLSSKSKEYKELLIKNY